MSNAKGPKGNSKPQQADPRSVAAMKRAAERLHHLSMAYVGSMKELAEGKPILGLTSDYPGLHVMRDLIDLVLLMRAEISAMINLLVTQGTMTLEHYTQAVTIEYDWLTKEKAKQFGCEISDEGLVFKAPTPSSTNPKPEENN